jgi:hypothetical protein
MNHFITCFQTTAAAAMSCSGNQSVGGTTSSSTESPVRMMVRSRSVLGRLPSYAQPTVASLLRASQSNDLISGSRTQLQMCPRCRPSKFIVIVGFAQIPRVIYHPRTLRCFRMMLTRHL